MSGAHPEKSWSALRGVRYTPRLLDTKTDQARPIYGMPILEVDKARTVMVIKKSMNPGFAGIDNPLNYEDKTLMLFGDARGFVGDVVRELTGGGDQGFTSLRQPRSIF